VRNKRRILVATLLLALVGAFAWFLLRALAPPDPVYEGKPLSSWLRQQPPIPAYIITNNGRSVSFYSGGISGPARILAFPKWLDSNSVPYLAHALTTRDGPLFKAYTNLWPRLPAALRKRLTEPVPARLIRENAAQLLLGTPGNDAMVAVPAVLRALETDDDPLVRNYALEFLKNNSGQHPNLITNLVQAMAANSDAAIRQQARKLLEQIRASALQRIDPETAAKTDIK
jgi:hypothetical protein